MLCNQELSAKLWNIAENELKRRNDILLTYNLNQNLEIP